MNAPECGYEIRIVRAAGRGTLGQDLLAHLDGCSNCREAAAIAQLVQDRVAGVEPGSGLADEAATIWQIAHSFAPSPAWKSFRKRLLFIRSLLLIAPIAVVIVVLRDRFVSSGGQVIETVSMFRGVLNSLPVDATMAFAGALFTVTALVVLRLASSD